MHVSEILDYHKLIEHRDNRLVSARSHPTLPLTIWNYTDAAQYGWRFDETLIQCRGLVLDEDGRVIARPFSKFMSADQPGHAEIDLDEPVEIFDKADGSLICVSQDPEYGAVISSRGSFESDQAKLAAELFHRKYDRFEFPTNFTTIFELTGPSNRIVLEYSEDELILLGGRKIDSGKVYTPPRVGWEWNWPGRVVEKFPYTTIRELLLQPDRAGAEGYVIYTNDGRMLKHKFDAYVDLHRIIFGMSENTIFERLVNGETRLEMIASLPDEIYDWADEVATRLEANYNVISQQIEIDFQATEQAAGLLDRKKFAQIATQKSYPAALFARLDGKNLNKIIWNYVNIDRKRS